MTLTPANMREDLAFLRDEWAPLDRSFTHGQRRRFDEIVAAAIDASDALSPAGFELEIMRAVAVARNGHSSVRSLLRFLPPLPLRAWWFADGLYVVSAHRDFARLLGARIETFGAFTAEQALAAVAPFIAGTEQRIRYLSAFYLASPAVLHRIDATEVADSASITFRMPDRRACELRLPYAASFDPAFAEPDGPYFGYSALIPGDTALPDRWPHVLDTITDRPLIYRKAADVSVA
jgi:hypothetical protein